jgi:hypothetical protein
MITLRNSFLAVCAVAIMALCVPAAKADVFHLTGNNSDGNPFDVTANVSQSGSQITVVLTNNIGNQSAINQSISGFQFHITGFGGQATSGFAGSGRTVDYSGTGNVFNDVGTNGPDSINWALSSPGAGTFKLLTDLPEDTIAGVPTSSTSTTVTYGDANSSLESGSHQPIVVQTATFVFTVTGLPAGAHFDGISFFLGTGPEQVNCTSCGVTQTPEPMSMMLLGTGLIGLAAGLRRRIRRRN